MLRRCTKDVSGRLDSFDNALFGQAFSIADTLMAIRWSKLVRQYGYHLRIAQCHRHADEVLEIRLRTHRTPLIQIDRRDDAVVSTNCVGEVSTFPTLADALCAIVPLSARERSFVIEGRISFRDRAMRGVRRLFGSSGPVKRQAVLF